MQSKTAQNVTKAQKQGAFGTKRANQRGEIDNIAKKTKNR